MESILLKYAVFFVLVSSPGSTTTAYVDHVSHESVISANILTRFWKVPWMNLNSSWADRVAPACGNDISTLFRSADDGDMWALQMLDASSKIPSGILQGNIYDLGMYDQCIKVTSRTNPANIQGRQCGVSFGMPPKFITNAAEMLHIQKLSPFNPTPNVDLSFGAAVCLPASCGVDDVANFVDASVRSNPELSKLEVRVVHVQCSDVEAGAFTPATVLVISFFALIVTLLMFCTTCDFLIKARPDCSSRALGTLAKFSLYANAIKLVSTEVPQGSMSAIHGLRFIGMFTVICAHRLICTIASPYVNLEDIHGFKDSPIAALGLTFPMGVDTFFILSGFFVTYSFLGRLHSGGKISLFKHFYLRRYLRIAPPIAALLLFQIFILPRLGSGPVWESVMQISSGLCQKNGWANLFFVHNVVHGHELCMTHTWYVSAEMQLFWLSPIILYPLHHRPKFGLAILSVISIVSFITPAVIILNNHVAAVLDGTKTLPDMAIDTGNFYIQTHTRALPYFVGMFCGYFFVKKKKALTEAQTVINWILASLFFMFCVWNASHIQPGSSVYNPLWEASYVSFGRLAWSLAIAWIVYATATGSGGPVGRFLSLPVFVPFSRLSFGIYLVSYLFQLSFKATTSSAEYYSSFRMMFQVWGDLAMSTILALPLTLCFETPSTVLEKILTAKGPAKIE